MTRIPNNQIYNYLYFGLFGTTTVDGLGDSCVDPALSEVPFDASETVFDTFVVAFFGKQTASSEKQAYIENP